MSPVARHGRPVLIGTTYPTSRPAKPDPLTATKKLNLRCRSGPAAGRAYLRVSASGAYVRVLMTSSAISESNTVV